MNHTTGRHDVASASALAVALALLATACGPPPPPAFPPAGGGGTQVVTSKPDWVDGKPGRFPDMQYLTGVGRGAGRMACESDARAALAKIFIARVSQVSRDWQGHFSRVNAAGRVAVEAMKVTQLTQVSTDKVLKGAQISQIWRGPQGFHCLATLERLPAARNLGDEIDRLDVQIANYVGEGDKADNTTAKFLAYKRAMELLQQREALNAELRIVRPQGGGKPPIHGWAALVGKFTGAQSKVKIGLKMSGNRAVKFQTCLAEELGKQGIKVTETSSDVDLLVRGKLSWRRAGYVNGSYMVKIDVNLRVFNTSNGKTVAAIAEELKSGRPQFEQALQTAASKLCFKIAPIVATKVRASLSR